MDPDPDPNSFSLLDPDPGEKISNKNRKIKENWCLFKYFK